MSNSSSKKLLQGTTCYISRIKDHGQDIGRSSFATLHSLVYKVLRLTNVGYSRSGLHEILVGSEMKILVKRALTQILSISPTDQLVDDYYIALRKYEAGEMVFNKPYGKSFLNAYNALKKKGLDWEESLQLATYYLENNHVGELKGFNFKNIILLNPELLKQPRNQNAYLFFKAFYKWNQKNNYYNIYIKQNNKLKRANGYLKSS